MKQKGRKTKAETKQKSRVMLYIDTDVLKEFKKLAIDEEKSFSDLAQEAFEAYTQNRKRSS